MTTPTQALRETKDFKGYLVKADAAQGIIEAVVNVFGIVDLGDDIIHNGAYVKTLNERGNKVKVRVLDSHKTDSILRVIGKPIEIREIGRDELFSLAPDVKAQHPEATGGLFTRTQFLMDTPEGEGAFKRLAAGAVDEWSIALDPLDVDYGTAAVEGKDRRVRNIRQIRLYEYSPVIWGMNQATVTTDIKADEHADAPETDTKTESPAPEPKMATLGTKLEASLRLTAAFCITDWLGQGMIEAESMDALNSAVDAGMTTFRGALPAEIADMPLHDYWNAEGAENTKAGRMISGANRDKIQAAIDALQALMDASAPADTPMAEDQTDEKTLTGSDAQESPATAPSITLQADATPEALADTIDRELSEVNLMMEMVA